jgi:hypothetical protein
VRVVLILEPGLGHSRWGLHRQADGCAAGLGRGDGERIDRVGKGEEPRRKAGGNMGCDRSQVLPAKLNAEGNALAVGGEFGFGDVSMGCHGLFFLIQWVANLIGGGVDGRALVYRCGHGSYLLVG